MGGACLDRLAVLDHRLDTVSADSTGKAFTLRLLTPNHGNRQPFSSEGIVDTEHLLRLLNRFDFGLMSRVPFLPEELGSAQEKTRTQLPADDVRPLIQKDGKITVGLHPLGIGCTDDGLGCRADNQRLGELTSGHEFPVLEFETVVGDHCAFLGESLDMLSLLLQVAQGNEEREVSVLVACRLEHSVERPLHPLPKSVTPRTDHHASAHLGILGHLRTPDDLLVPLGKIFFATRGNSVFVAFAHRSSRVAFWLLVTQASGGSARRNPPQPPDRQWR